MTLANPHLSITTLNINKLNSPIKIYRIDEWNFCRDLTKGFLRETDLPGNNTHRKGRNSKRDFTRLETEGEQG